MIYFTELLTHLLSSWFMTDCLIEILRHRRDFPPLPLSKETDMKCNAHTLT